MPQHDLVVANASGAAVRADINDALAALGSTMKGPNAPPAPIAGMMWLDDDTPSASVWTLKLYDGADWISIATFDISANTWAPVITRLALGAGSAAAPALTFGDADTGIWNSGTNELGFSAGGVLRLRLNGGGQLGINVAPVSDLTVGGNGVTLASDFGPLMANAYFDGAWRYVSNGAAWGLGNNFGGPTNGFCIATAAVNSSGPAAALAWNVRLAVPQSGPVTVDGKALQIQRGTEVSPTGVSFVDFTGIPAGVRRITIMFDNLSFVADNTLSIQLGDAGGIETTGYTGMVGIVAGAATGTINASSASQFSCFVSNWLAAEVSFGMIEMLNMSGNKWLIKSTLNRSGTLQIHKAKGAKILSDTLTTVRVKTDGSNYDGGAINFLLES